MLKFREYLEKIEEQNTVGVHNDGPGSGFYSGGGLAVVSTPGGSGILPSHWSDTEFLQNQMGFLDGIVRSAMDKLDVKQGQIPLRKGRSEVAQVEEKSNPVWVRTSDGMNLYFTRGEYRRCGMPMKGDTVDYAIQRHPNDYSDNCSQVQYCRTYRNSL